MTKVTYVSDMALDLTIRQINAALENCPTNLKQFPVSQADQQSMAEHAFGTQHGHYDAHKDAGGKSK